MANLFYHMGLRRKPQEGAVVESDYCRLGFREDFPGEVIFWAVV